jgi:4-amino-4-deoxy-L-arabinose transferase-like glycosyltransferase
MVSRDTVVFVDYAKAFATGPLTALAERDQHPLFPALVLLTQNLRQTVFKVSSSPEAWAMSAQIVACVGGLFCVVILYGLVKWLWGERAGLWAALWMAMVPEACHLSSDGLSDMPHLAFYLLALSLALRGFLLPCKKSLVAAAMVSGVAYLMRPEGGELFVLVIAGLCRYPRAFPIRQRLFLGAAACGAFLLMAGPYMAVTGQLVQKKSLLDMFQLERESGLPATFAWIDAPMLAADGKALSLPRAVNTIIEKSIRATRVSYVVLFALAAVPVLRPRFKKGLVPILGGAAALHGLVLLGLGTKFGYVSMRHTMILVAIMLIVAAGVADRIVDLATSRKPGKQTAVITSCWMAILVIVPTMPWVLERLYPNVAHYGEAARYIRENYPPEAMVVTTRQRIPFYADRPWQNVPDDGEVAAWLYHLHAQTRVVAIASDRVLKKNPDFFEQLQRDAIESGRLKPVREFAPPPGSDKGAVLLYEVVHEPR